MKVSKELSESIRLFFEEPNIQPRNPGIHSVLYLLRRDILTCMGIDPNTNQKIKYQALWPAAMSIFAGIDLLAKFYTGTDAPNRSGERFKTFIKKYFVGIKPYDDEVILQLRNALMHSFGLYSNQYRFTLSSSFKPIVQKISENSNKYNIDLLSLNNFFDAAIQEYTAELMMHRNLQFNFKNMFLKYGKIRMAN